MLSRSQQIPFRKVVEQAWSAHCDRSLGSVYGDKLDRRKWYESELYKAAKVTSTKCKKFTAREFDLLCLHFAVLSGQNDQIDYWSKAEERRLLWIISRQAEACSLPIMYVQQIAVHMGLFSGSLLCLSDLPKTSLWRIAIALNLYAKRHGKGDLLKRLCKPSEIPMQPTFRDDIPDPVCECPNELEVSAI